MRFSSGKPIVMRAQLVGGGTAYIDVGGKHGRRKLGLRTARVEDVSAVLDYSPSGVQ
jgi:hypothetical protein